MWFGVQSIEENINRIDCWQIKELIIKKSVEIKVDIIEMEMMPDHVHLIIEVDPQFGINKAVRSIKGYSSHILRKEFKTLTTRLPTLWTNSYFVSTVGGAPLEIIKQYVANQKRSEVRNRNANNVQNKAVADKGTKKPD